MPLLIFKLLAALIIFLTALIAGLLPIRLAKRSQRFLTLGDAFASGIFLGASLLHMLPQAHEDLLAYTGHFTYPYAALIALASLLVLLFLERRLLHLEHHCKGHLSPSTPYILALILSIHSIIAGAALGINATLTGALILFIAIVAHKGAASFSLTSNLHRYQIPEHSIRPVIITFSLMTPVGIFLGGLMHGLLQSQSGLLAQGIFNAVAAGTFLYIGGSYAMNKECLMAGKSTHLWEFLYLILGVSVMAIVAIWL